MVLIFPSRMCLLLLLVPLLSGTLKLKKLVKPFDLSTPLSATDPPTLNASKIGPPKTAIRMSPSLLELHGNLSLRV